MPKWLIVLLAIAALAGVIVLEQAKIAPSALSDADRPAPPAEAPATTPPARSTPVVRETPALPPPAPGAPVQTAPAVVPEAVPTSEMPTQTPSEALLPAAVQTPSLEPTTPQTSAAVWLTEPVAPSSGARPAAARWAGMPLDAFLTRASGELVALSPETVTWLGIAADLGMRDDRLDPLSVEAEAAYYGLAREILYHLDSYDLALETPRDRWNAEIYRAFLVDSLEGYAYTDHFYGVSSYMDSYPTYIAWFLTSIHPLGTLANVEDYISRLTEIPLRFRELQARLADSEALAAVPPKFMLEQAVDQIRSKGETPARETDFYATLEAAIAEMPDLEEAAASALLARAVETLEQDVLPAYGELAEYVSGMALRASDDAGVWKQEDGDAFYAYILRSYTTTDLTADEIYDLGVVEVARIEAEIREAATAAGLDGSLSIAQIFADLSAKTGVSLGEETITRSKQILDDIAPRIAPAFLRMPTQDLVVVDGGYDTYFSAGTLDGSRPGQYFAPTLSPQPIYDLATVTYHEGIPGHGFQAAYAYEADIPPYVAGLSFTAYAEGWALYAERLAWELGAYDNDPYGNLGRLQDELFRAVRLVLDPGIHAKRWTYEQAVGYMLEHTGLQEDYVRSEAERYIVSPGQAVTYKIGMIEILALRDRAKAELGEAFDLARFHDAVLGRGELPISLLRRAVDEYIADGLRDVPETSAP